MSREIRDRILRAATPEEQARHDQVRQQIEQELPELQQWAREAAARHKPQVPVGTTFTSDETHVVQAIDAYAVQHSLQDRSAVVREALANLLGIEIARQ